MFTSIDKALVALIMGVLYLMNTFFGVDLGWSQETVATVIAALTPVLVWLIPNKKMTDTTTMRSPWIVAVIALFVVSLLGACTEADRKLSPQTRLYQIQANFAVAQETAADYASLPFCSETVIIGCSDPATVVKLNDLAKDVTAKIKLAEPVILAVDPNAIVSASTQQARLAAAASALQAMLSLVATLAVGRA